MAQEKRGYALKVERGERPFSYSQEHRDWRNSLGGKGQDAAARAWAKRFAWVFSPAHNPTRVPAEPAQQEAA